MIELFLPILTPHKNSLLKFCHQIAINHPTATEKSPRRLGHAKCRTAVKDSLLTVVRPLLAILLPTSTAIATAAVTHSSFTESHVRPFREAIVGH